MILDAGAAFLRLLPAETAHRATIFLTRNFGALAPTPPPPDGRLALRVLGRNFSNPIGLAAGFDKNAVVPNTMLRLGFGFVECGTVTPRPQRGNPRPRLFRLAADRAVINRMGFNNDGMDEAAICLAHRARRGVVGINIGANKDSADRIADYRACFERLAPFADYVTVNVSSPNTPGLRGLQNRDELTALLGVLTKSRASIAPTVPLLLKIAPDLDAPALDDIAAVVKRAGIEGLIVSNTTVARPATLQSADAKEAGGLSGAPLFELSTAVLRAMRARIGPAITLIGVGGISSGEQAYAKIRAGASLVQLYTAFALEGPEIVPRIQRELIACLDRDGFATVADAIGAGAR